MGRKKAFGAPSEAVKKPFCFFCDRNFDDEIVLLQHQRAKHFRCAECGDGTIGGKCESVQGLIVHTLKVHGKTLPRVPNALQGRESAEFNVYGMDGVPESVLKEKGYPLPSEPEAEGARRGAGRGGITPPPGSVDADCGQPPSIPNDFGGMSGMPHMQRMGMPGVEGVSGILPPLPPLPGVEGAGVPQDFLDFLGGAAQPPGSASQIPPGGMGIPGFPGMHSFQLEACFPGPGAALPPLPGLPGQPPLPGLPALQQPQRTAPAAGAPMAIPSAPMPANGSHAGASTPVQQRPPPKVEQQHPQGVKRPLEPSQHDDDEEDISVEEKRAFLDVYRTLT